MHPLQIWLLIQDTVQVRTIIKDSIGDNYEDLTTHILYGNDSIKQDVPSLRHAPEKRRPRL